MGLTLRDNHLKQSVFSPICSRCVYFEQTSVLSGKPSCRAFTSVPDEIWTGKVDHKTPYPGDKGIRFREVRGWE